MRNKESVEECEKKRKSVEDGEKECQRESVEEHEMEMAGKSVQKMRKKRDCLEEDERDCAEEDKRECVEECKIERQRVSACRRVKEMECVLKSARE